MLTVNDLNNVAGSYCFRYECADCVHNPYLDGNDLPACAACYWYSECVYGTANTYSVSMYDAGTFTVWAKAKTQYGCVDSISTLIKGIGKPILISGSDNQTVNGGTAIQPILYATENANATGLPPGVSGSWMNGTFTVSGVPTTIGTYTYTIAVDGCLSAQGTIAVRGGNQQQGSCTFTQPPVVGTFAAFDKNYSAATYVTLTDERDGNNYTVVKIGGFWIMAQNLNYQKNLTWEANANQPSTFYGLNPALIGHFWCPGEYDGPTTTLAGCDVWGALYSWEMAMSLDGLGEWTEYTTYYNTGSASATNSNFNHGRTASGSGTGGRGICPPNWHVPTDFEWGVILDGLESGGGTAHQNADVGWYGTNAGSNSKSSCNCPTGTTVGDPCVNDTLVNWYDDDIYKGTDIAHFRVVPTGLRACGSKNIVRAGVECMFWSSTARNVLNAYVRRFDFEHGQVFRGNEWMRCNAFSVRCVKD
jgi:uncharacterized protein (TIGR02145 family)